MGKAIEWIGADGCRAVAEAIIPRVDDRKTTDAEVWAPCPFHDEQEASFSYNSAKDLFSCFGCDARGDIIALYGKLNGLDASAAFKEFRAAHAPGVNLQRRPALRTPARVATDAAEVKAKATHLPSAIWHARALALVDHAHQQLLANAEQMAWLAARGIHERAVHRFRLGWIEEDLFRTFESWGIPPEIKKDGTQKRLWIPSGILIPTYRAETVVHLQIRRPEGEPRFYMMPGSANDPAPMLFIRGTWPGPNRAAIVIEACLDAVLVAQEAGDLVDVIAVRAAKNLPADEMDVQTARGIAWFGLWLDRDAAGDGGTVKWMTSTAGNPDKPDGGFAQAVGASASDIRPEGAGKMDPGDYHKLGKSIRQHIIDHLPRAWRVKTERPTCVAGQKILGSGEENPPKMKVHADVVEFGWLLEKCPLVAIVSEDRISLRAMRRNPEGEIVPDVSWEMMHWAIMQRADALFWAPGQERSAVQDYLDNHPQAATGVHGRNYWAPLGARKGE